MLDEAVIDATADFEELEAEFDEEWNMQVAIDKLQMTLSNLDPIVKLMLEQSDPEMKAIFDRFRRGGV